MKQHEMIVSCAEYYSYLKNIPAHAVFQSFDRNGILHILLDTQRQFPEADPDFFMGMIDGLLALESDAGEKEYGHYTERAALGTAVIALLAQAHKLDDVEACRMYYTSKTAAALSEEKNGLYKKSPAEIFAQIEAE